MKDMVNKSETLESSSPLDAKLILIGRCLGASRLALLPFKFLGCDIYAPGYLHPQLEPSKFVFVNGDKIRVCTAEEAIAYARTLRCL